MNRNLTDIIYIIFNKYEGKLFENVELNRLNAWPIIKKRERAGGKMQKIWSYIRGTQKSKTVTHSIATQLKKLLQWKAELSEFATANIL